MWEFMDLASLAYLAAVSLLVLQAYTIFSFCKAPAVATNTESLGGGAITMWRPAAYLHVCTS